MPYISTFKACSGSDVYFSIRFGDVDQAICSKGIFLKQFPGADYVIYFSTNSTFATFPNGTNMQKAIVSFSVMENPYNPLEVVDIFISNPLLLSINISWDGTPIVVTATVTEISVNMPPCHTGTYIDPVYTYSWTINPETGDTPTDMVTCGKGDNSFDVLRNNIIGSWEVKHSVQEIRSDTVYGESVSVYDIQFNQDGTGIKSNVFGNDVDFEWYYQYNPEKVVIVSMPSGIFFEDTQVYDVQKNESEG